MTIFKKIVHLKQRWYVVEQWPSLGACLRSYDYYSEAAALEDARTFMANYGHPAFVLNEEEKEQWILNKASKVLEESLSF